MIRILFKEGRQLFPIACLWLSVLVLGYLTKFSTERLDEQTFSSWCDGYCDYNSGATVVILTALFALVTAYSLFPREHDDSTIDFLRALPVSRSKIFIGKVLAAWLLLCFINVLSYSVDYFLLGANPESIGGRFYPQVWTTLLWRDCLVAFIFLSHGVLLSWFRTLGLLLYAIYLLVILWAESQFGTSGIWSVFTLLSNEYDGSKLLVNAKALSIHAGIALGFLLVAARLWSVTESSASGGKQSTLGMTIFRVLLSVSGFVLLAGVLIYRVGVGTGTPTTSDLRVATTEHYRFVYKASREETVQYMLEHAEADYEALAELLGVTDLPSIRVDLSAQSEHAAGLATWKKIQMDLNAFESDVSQRRVLSHETTHVLQAVESDRALARNHSAAKFFIEGMAQYTSFDVVPELERRNSNWQLAAISWKRQNIEFLDLIDAAGFGERFDPELHYSLGDLWTRAFVSNCGDSAMGDFLRAAGREEASKDLAPVVFWRDTTAQINCDLDTVNELWRVQMEALYAEVEQQLFPVFTDVVIDESGPSNQISITAKLSPYEPGNKAVDASANIEATGITAPSRFIVRIGAASTRVAAGVDPVFRGQLLEDGERVNFKVPRNMVTGTRFRYQLGFTPSAGSRYYYEQWQRGSL